MNFHSDIWIMNRLKEHYKEALEHFPEDRIVGIFCQGSQNYGLDYAASDIDTKLIVLPTFEEVVFNKKPHSTTHIRANDEHIDFKDLRLMFQTFRKQNINFIEILFTKYKIINPMYSAYWDNVTANNERIAHYNIATALKAMRGTCLEKFHSMEHPYPSKLAILEKYGYDGKQLHHLVRVEEHMRRFLNWEPYADCLQSKQSAYLLDLKTNKLSLREARKLAQRTLDNVNKMVEDYNSSHVCKNDTMVDFLLDTVQYDIFYSCMNVYFKGE